ncbi:alpha/beta-hydrolase [Macrolepiota fuliginosa MF-IS2]|uniref:Alpha/beta-hydrolase n=1 Tax=Macrolepiota fuliginosa MF-IS2 TaxID=1400762 RepID=A0A9P6BWV6_9AGAR|nr:alpha/beta-hydrolase [Macrolepiota fuliginosa MF-IS2]
MPEYKDQLGATLTHPDGAVMTYDVLGARHLATNQIPIVLIGGMSSLRCDWDRLANVLMEIRPVLLLDHRGMGDSTYTPQTDEEITIELYARDILELLIHLQWERLAICGFSMGGAIAQQLLLLPYHTSNPTPTHPFEITHVFLAATLASPMRDKRYGLKFFPLPTPRPGGKKRTREERKEIARPTLEGTFDEAWLRDPRNRERFEVLLERMISGRPTKTIVQQARTIRNLAFNAPHSFIPRHTSILVIHGQNDRIVPFSSSQEILSFIPHAESVSVGSKRGQVPNLDFGHQWFEYFGAQVWVDVMEVFMNTESGCGGTQAKL